MWERVIQGSSCRTGHTNLSFRASLPPPLPPPFILTLVYPHCGPFSRASSPLSLSFPRSAAVDCVYSAREREREGPEKGQWRLSERLSTPWLSKEVCMGASQHPFHKLHSHPPVSFTHTLVCHTGAHTHTHFLVCSTLFCLTSPKTPSHRSWLFEGCSRDPVTSLQDPHTVSHFPAILFYFSAKK